MINNKDERTHFFRKIYLPHFILERVAKGLMLVMCERWVGDWDRLLHDDPKFSDHRSTSSSFCWAAQPRSLRTQALCLELILNPRNPISNCDWDSNSNCNFNSNGTEANSASNSNWTQAACGTWLYNGLTSTCFLWAYTSAPHVHRSRWYADILDRMDLLSVTQVHLLIDGRGSICYRSSM